MSPIVNFPRAADVQGAIQYVWDDRVAITDFQEVDRKLVGRLSQVSQRAVLAFMCGSAQWVVARLRSHCDDSAPDSFLEGAWAMSVHVRYCGYGTGKYWQSHSSSGWTGPVKGVLKEGLLRLEIALQELPWQSNDPGWRAGLLSALAVHVLPDPGLYTTWCGKVLDRFESLYPRLPDDPVGDVVPWQAADLDADFHVEQTESLINGYLAKLDPGSNRFLSSPEGMLQVFPEDEEDEEDARFAGTPYVFNLDADRRARL